MRIGLFLKEIVGGIKMDLDMKKVGNMEASELRLEFVRLFTENEMMRSQLTSVLAERNVLFQKQAGVVLPEQKKVQENNQGNQKSQQQVKSDFILPQGSPRSSPPANIQQSQGQQRPVIEKPKIEL